MFYKKFAQILSRFTLVAGFIFFMFTGCTFQDDVSNGSAKNGGYTYSPHQYSGHHHRSGRHSKNSLAADNPASEDYFLNQPPPQSDDDNLWGEIKGNFKLEHYPNSPAVQAQIRWFTQNQGYLNRTARRAAPFMYYIFQETKARHLPSELVLLPIIESAYNPFVSSYAGAGGLWQIEPGTGRSFGLRQDFWYDGRKDVSTSTKAALDYLNYLQNFFDGNWLLAIAAYDTGQGNVEAAIRRNARAGLETDFWSLHLASETKAYIPKLLALSVIIDNPQAYGITLPIITNAPYLGEVEVNEQLSLEKAANLAGISLEELKTLNPGYKRSTLSPNQPYKLLLPIDRIPTFKRNLLNNSEKDVSDSLWSHYKIQSNDTWYKIAQRFNSTAQLLQSINHLESDSTPPVGKIILIPETARNQSAFAKAFTQEAAQSESSENTENSFTYDYAHPLPELSDESASDDTEDKSESSHSTHSETKGLHLKKVIHTVKQGESLSSIARAYKISHTELAHWNNLSPNQSLKPGKTLTIWQKETTHAASTSHIIITHHHTPHHHSNKKRNH